MGVGYRNIRHAGNVVSCEKVRMAEVMMQKLLAVLLDVHNLITHRLSKSNQVSALIS